MAENLWGVSFFLVGLVPYLQHFFRTKSLRFSEDKSLIVKAFRNIGIHTLYSFFVLVYYIMSDDEPEFFFQLMIYSVLTATVCIAYLLFDKKLMLSKRDRIRLSVYTALLIPTFPVTFFILVFVLTQTKEAKKLMVAKTKWAAEKEVFLKKYKKESRRLEKKRGEKNFQEVRVREFLEANPDAVLYRAPKNAREFEIICANWMQLWGEMDARATQFSGDGGLDVVSSNFGAQVKFYADKPVGRPEVQALYGAASGNGLQPAFFAYSSGYTDEALEWAKMVGIACFTFVPNGNTFQFAANTEQAAELALREEGWSYPDWQEWNSLEETLKTYQQEPQAYEFPSWLRKKTDAATSQTTTIEISDDQLLESDE